jgi:hypothetical protein
VSTSAPCGTRHLDALRKQAIETDQKNSFVRGDSILGVAASQ